MGLSHGTKCFPWAGAFKPELKFLIQVLRAANAVLNDAAPQPVVVVGPGPTNRLSLPPPSPAPASSREEAIRKLVEVAEYFRKNERSSPIPLLLDRAKRLASMNFLELLEDLGLGKEAAPEFRRLAGISETPPNPDGSGG